MENVILLWYDSPLGIKLSTVIKLFKKFPQRILGDFFMIIITYFHCQRGNRATKRGCLGGRIITPRNVGKNSQILRNPLKFAFLTIFGCK